LVVVVIKVVEVVNDIKPGGSPSSTLTTSTTPVNFFHKDCNLPKKHVVIAYKYTVRVV